jgi:GNAT superfamily N-acetyltransferase
VEFAIELALSFCGVQVMQLQVSPLSQHPELEDEFWSDELMSAWPAFMLEDPIANLIYSDKRFERFLEFVLVAVDTTDPNKVVARAVSVPFCLGEDFERYELPDGGWDTIARWADQDAFLGRTPNAVSALEILVHPETTQQGISGQMLAAMRANAKRLGFKDLYAPVRPSHKHLEPHTHMHDYAFRIREDGLPVDPWLRVHVRAGGRIIKIAPCSMTITGTLEQWRTWTELPLKESGEIVIPKALVPVYISQTHDYGVYIEPNVWVHHAL